MTLKFFYFSVFSFLVYSCTPQKVEFSEIKFDTGPCFGTCPIFTITIAADGTAHYSAEMYNERQGEFNTTIKSRQLDSLNQLIELSDFAGLKNEYSIEGTDHPTYTLKVKLSNGLTKTIKDYGPNGPVRLKNLYHLIFSLRQSQDWK